MRKISGPDLFVFFRLPGGSAAIGKAVFLQRVMSTACCLSFLSSRVPGYLLSALPDKSFRGPAGQIAGRVFFVKGYELGRF